MQRYRGSIYNLCVFASLCSDFIIFCFEEIATSHHLPPTGYSSSGRRRVPAASSIYLGCAASPQPERLLILVARCFSFGVYVAPTYCVPKVHDRVRLHTFGMQYPYMEHITPRFHHGLPRLTAVPADTCGIVTKSSAQLCVTPRLNVSQLSTYSTVTDFAKFRG